LANSPQARKRSRQAENRRRHNASQRSMVRTYIKRVDAAMTSAVPVIDGMVGKGIMHKNKAARHKSRLHARIKALGA
jgi:small subunit ribosomal protein S20